LVSAPGGSHRSCYFILSSPEFVKGLRPFFQTFDVEYGLVKSASFGFAVTMIGSIDV
jgi:ABC-type transporter Mla maintaining outer membrane lipid asymmetry permease subunit MlaE